MLFQHNHRYTLTLNQIYTKNKTATHFRALNLLAVSIFSKLLSVDVTVSLKANLIQAIHMKFRTNAIWDITNKLQTCRGFC